MSGGVDSSVSAHLLRQAGWEVLGVTMKILISRPSARSCCGAEAALVCNQMGLPHYFIDVTGAFKKLIIERFRRAYAQGRTPNPCVDCNTLLKFSLLWDFLRSRFGIEHLATGHYARVLETPRGSTLARARDRAKDQSYFIYGIARENLPNLVLPLGQRTKKEVRSIAAELNLSVAERPESMELCFAAQGDYRLALWPDQADKPGDLTDMQGNKIGTHKGISHYTLGQRRGVGFAGGQPLYVGRIDPKTNTVALGTREEVSSRTVAAADLNVLVPDELAPHTRLFGKIRSYGDPQACTIAAVGRDRLVVEFDEPQFAPCPGQSLVLYDGRDNIVAGGTIVPTAT